jgi:hypothetical protein
VVTGHNFESILDKDHPCHVCFKLADWFQRRLLNNFPIGPMLKLCPLTAAILDRDRGHWHADILKRAYLCQVSVTGSPEPLVLF